MSRYQNETWPPAVPSLIRVPARWTRINICFASRSLTGPLQKPADSGPNCLDEVSVVLYRELSIFANPSIEPSQRIVIHADVKVGNLPGDDPEVEDDCPNVEKCVLGERFPGVDDFEAMTLQGCRIVVTRRRLPHPRCRPVEGGVELDIITATDRLYEIDPSGAEDAAQLVEVTCPMAVQHQRKFSIFGGQPMPHVARSKFYATGLKSPTGYRDIRRPGLRCDDVSGPPTFDDVGQHFAAAGIEIDNAGRFGDFASGQLLIGPRQLAFSHSAVEVVEIPAAERSPEGCCYQLLIGLMR